MSATFVSKREPSSLLHAAVLALCAFTSPSICVASDEGYARVPASRDLTESIRFDGDLRYRYEAIDDADASFDRQRLRARAGVQAQVNPSTRAVLRLSTGSGDPRSAHLTFSGGYSRKTIGLDLAYLEWTSQNIFAAKLGKIPFPTWRPAMSYFTGGDFNPEGVALNYASPSGFYAAAYNFWLEDRSTSSDSEQRGAQIGWRSHDERATILSAALTLSDFDNTKNRSPFLDGLTAYGNSVNPDGALASGFRIVDFAAELINNFYFGSITSFAHFARNSEASTGADAYAGGFEFKTQTGAQWSAGYQYARVGRDALFGQHFDGDFGGGRTGSKGHVMHAAFEPAPRMSTRLSYFINDVEPQFGSQRRFRLLQLDVNCLF